MRSRGSHPGISSEKWENVRIVFSERFFFLYYVRTPDVSQDLVGAVSIGCELGKLAVDGGL